MDSGTGRAHRPRLYSVASTRAGDDGKVINRIHELRDDNISISIA